MLISYAQNLEDVVLMRALSHVERGVYIDIGANDPVEDSVSLAFYNMGWRGVHVEPAPDFASRLEEARPEERVVRAAVCNGRGQTLFYLVGDTGMNTGEASIAREHIAGGLPVTAILVDSLPLSDVLDSVSGDVHWLKIDVEGMERVVLESWGDSAVRPWIVLIESTKPNSPETNHKDWEPLIEDLGYEFVYFDGLNRFYVSREHGELKPAFAVPPNYFDDFTVTEHSIFARAPAAELREKDKQLAKAVASVSDFDTRLMAEITRHAAELSAASARVDAERVGYLDRISAAEKVIGDLQQAVAAALGKADAEHADNLDRIATAEKIIGDLRQALAEAEARREISARALHALRDQFETSQADANVSIMELQRKLSISERLMRDEADHRREVEYKASHAANLLMEDLRTLGERNRSVDQELLGAREDVDRLSQRVRKLEHDLRNRRAAYMDVFQENQALLANYRDTERALANVTSTLSWNLAAPLRWFIAILRAVSSGMVDWSGSVIGNSPRRLARRLVITAAARRGAPTALNNRPTEPSTETGADISPTSKARTLVIPDAGPQPASPVAEGPIRYVFVDHTIACSTNTGVQRVVRGLAKELLGTEHPVRFVKWDDASDCCVLISLEERAHLAKWNGPVVTADEFTTYQAGGAAIPPATIRPAPGSWLLVPEVTHISFHAKPVTAAIIQWAKNTGLKVGFIYYDAIPLRRPEFASMAPVHAQYMRELRMADVVWPISRWVADELASFWRVGRDADTTLPPIIHPIHLPAEFDRPRVTEYQGGEKLILSVGTLEPRKNQTTLIRAFQDLLAERPDCGWRLVLVGNLHPLVEDEVRAATQTSSSIEFRGHVSDNELSDLYDNCAFTVFPSVDEGFGLPILESLWHGKPCICADFGAMAEVASGGGCITIDVRERDLLRAALERLMDDVHLRGSLSEDAVIRPMSRWSEYVSEMDASRMPRRKLIYYWVDSTISFAANTGIQRVARQLARGLIEAGFRLVPVKWGGVEQPFLPVSDEELTHFARWNGPPAEQWHQWVPPEAHRDGGWFVMAELPLNLADAEQKVLRAVAEAAGLRTAAIFYDTIPWKMKDIYPESASRALGAYMKEVTNYSSVLTISEYTRSSLMSELTREFDFPRSKLGHINAVSLAGEFPERSGEEASASARAGDTINILCVGTVEPRKNHERVLDAFALACQVSASPLRLTIVGGGYSIEPDLAVRVRARVAEDHRIAWEEHADDALFKRLYDECDFTIYPSVEEGFGLPILESLWHNKPVICANFGAMLEVAMGGGCVTVDVKDVRAMAHAMVELANSPLRRQQLVDTAKQRKFRSWREYAVEVAGKLGLWTYPDPDAVNDHRNAMGMVKRPRLSVCISTYNRAEWLSASLRNIARLYPSPIPGVEFVVCDNASTDQTPDVVRPYLTRPDFAFRRNPVNVGMLGNLRETAHAADGDYIWILGDDDLLRPGAIERVLQAIEANPNVSLVYLNYAYTRIDDARTVVDFDRFFAEATPIVPPEKDLVGPIREICAQNENFFTAIYTLVFRRDHALGAYSQNTHGRPFSTMLTCIPTTHYVLNTMMEATGVWIGDPQIVVNMNVSWMRYAPLWILERIPEVYAVAREKGVTADNIDRWRRHTLAGVAHFFGEIFVTDPLNNAAYFSPSRLVGRFADLPEFEAYRATLLEIYTRAHQDGHPAALEPPAEVFGPGEAFRSGGVVGDLRQPVPTT